MRLFGKRDQGEHTEPPPRAPRRLGPISRQARVGAREVKAVVRGLGAAGRGQKAGVARPRGLRPIAGTPEAGANTPSPAIPSPTGKGVGRKGVRPGGQPSPSPRREGIRPGGLRPLKPSPPARPSHNRLQPPSRRLAAALEEVTGQAAPPSLMRRFAGRVPWRRVALAALGTAIGLLLFAAYTNLARQPHLSDSDVRQIAFQAMASATPLPPRDALIYASVAPSVVQIVTDEKQDTGSEHAGGTGVILDQSAHILTALHVVQDATKIQVGFADGTVSDASIIATTPEKDIAVLGVASPPDQVIPATLGDPNSLQVGEPAVAIGNPFGLAYTTTAGIISGLNRSFKAPQTGQEMTGLIQFDAAVNPGNSGGPLVNNNGEVVGIVTALANPTDQSVFIGIGFAVPIDTAASAAGSPPF